MLSSARTTRRACLLHPPAPPKSLRTACVPLVSALGCGGKAVACQGGGGGGAEWMALVLGIWRRYVAAATATARACSSEDDGCCCPSRGTRREEAQQHREAYPTPARQKAAAEPPYRPHQYHRQRQHRPNHSCDTQGGSNIATAAGLQPSSQRCKGGTTATWAPRCSRPASPVTRRQACAPTALQTAKIAPHGAVGATCAAIRRAFPRVAA